MTDTALMKSVVYRETGPSSVLHVVEREPETPGPGEVRVRLVVSGVNPTDWKSRSGQGAGRSGEGERGTGLDGAGLIGAVGKVLIDVAASAAA